MTLFRRGARAALAGLVLAALTFLPGLLHAETVFSSKSEARVSAWITGYSYWDNSPPGSGAIARPVVHDKAGGTGTWDDPVTIAVGRSGGSWRYAPGTRIYLAGLKKYAVVEDLCGACGSGHGGRPHLDVYVGGATTSRGAAAQCAMKITAVQDIVVNPGKGYPVSPGEVAKTCGS
jgi:hypothetical protein